MVRLCIALAAAAAAYLSPASAAPLPTDKQPALYFPTTVGAKWVWYDGRSEQTWVVAKVQVKDGVSVVAVDEVSGGQAKPFLTVEVSLSGLRVVEKAGQKCESPQTIFRLPHTPGERWEADLSAGETGRPGLTDMAAVCFEDVDVPAGKFREARVDFDPPVPDEKRRYSIWFAPRIGQIKMTCPGTTLVLKSFTHAKD